MMVSRWWMKTLRRIINEEITVATQPIHPNANGGLSLADVARKTTKLDERMENLEKILEMAVALSQVEEIIEQPAPVRKSTPRKTTRSSTTRPKKK